MSVLEPGAELCPGSASAKPQTRPDRIPLLEACDALRKDLAPAGVLIKVRGGAYQRSREPVLSSPNEPVHKGTGSLISKFTGSQGNRFCHLKMNRFCHL